MQIDPLKPTVVACGGFSEQPGQVVFKPNTTFSNGYLGSRNDEERSEMRYVMRIAEFSESSKL